MFQNGLKHAITVISSNFVPYQDSAVEKLLYELKAVKTCSKRRKYEKELLTAEIQGSLPLD